MDPRVTIRVAFIDHTAVLSGAELGLARLIEASPQLSPHVFEAEDGPLVDRLRAAGAEVEVLGLPDGVRNLRREELRSPRRVIATAGPVSAYIRQLANRLSALNPDLVHTNSLKSGLYGAIAARMAGLPVLWGLHDRLAPDYLPALAVAPMRALAGSLPSAVVAPSRATLEAAGRPWRRGLLRAVIPLPVTAPDLTYTARADVRCVGLVGRLTPWKGQRLFLQAFAAAFPTGDVRARIVGSALFGEDDYAASLALLAAELGIAGRVDFRGFRSDVGAELAEMDIAVNASLLPETLGQTIIEALGAGVPTIAPRAGGPLDYIVDGVNGLLFTPGDATQLAVALRRLSDDLGLRRRLSTRGRRAATQFSPEVAAPKMFALYEQILGSAARAR